MQIVFSCYQLKTMGYKIVFVRLIVISNKKIYNEHTKNKNEETKSCCQRSPSLEDDRKENKKKEKTTKHPKNELKNGKSGPGVVAHAL